MKRTKTFEIEYNYFEPGTKVTPASSRCPLEAGKVYVVTKCFEPCFYGDDCVVHLEGATYGIRTDYLKEVE